MLVITIARKPLSESTVAKNVLVHGTGGINIEASRIGSGVKIATLGKRSGWTPENTVSTYVPGSGRSYTNEGRWPTNLILSHLFGCQCTGTTTAKRNFETGNKCSKEHVVYGDGLGANSTTSHTETVASWTCEPGCPVAALDGQSGITTNTSHYSYKRSGTFIGGIPSQPEKDTWKVDTGGASRFFKTVQNE
jgi:hypothetical protein